MQTGLIHLHNVLRWIILIFLFISIVRSLYGWLGNKTFTRGDRTIWLITLIFAHLTLFLGLYQWLFGRYGMLTTSPPEGTNVMKDKFYRFFWIEHPLTMIIAIILITLGYRMAKKLVDDDIKFKGAFWYFTFALVLILIRVPWPFLKEVGRPLFPGM
jgi:hypothetical protein